MPKKPTIVIIGGAGQTSDFYNYLYDAFDSHGFPVIVPNLPTCSGRQGEIGQKSPADDAEVVQTVIESLIQAGQTVVLVPHSYEGVVAASLDLDGLSLSIRTAHGLRGGVDRIIWFASMAMPENLSLIDANDGNIPEINVCHDNGTYDHTLAGEVLFDELSIEERAHWETRLIPHSQKFFDHVYANAAYNYVPSVQIITEKDRTFPVAYQEAFAQSIGASVVRLEVGHGGHLSHPDLVAGTILKIMCDYFTPSGDVASVPADSRDSNTAWQVQFLNR